ncbi:MAG: nucleotidyl transferase AbiEii/AbiGii toxin family protein [Promethearchaeota archaeon]
MIKITSKKLIKNQGISIRDKLKNIANKQKKQANLVYLAYIFERFLYRVFKSKFKENLILKGGVLLYCENLDIRQTVDIDFLAQNISNQKSEIKKIMQEICKIPSPDPVIFNGDNISLEKTMNRDRYGGFKIKIPCSFTTIKENLQIDIGFKDIIYPRARTLSYPLLLNKKQPFTIKGYTIETFIAEKIHSIYFLGNANTRMKDYYDLYKLSELLKLNQIVLLKAIKMTFERRETNISSEELLSVLKDHSLERDFYRYCRKKRLTPIKFDLVMVRLEALFLPIFELIGKNKNKYKKTWNIHFFQWD